MNYFDIGILVIVLIVTIIGFAKGFLKTLSSLFSWLISIVVSVLLAKVVANMIVDIPFVSKYFLNNPDGFSFAGWIYELLPDNMRIDMSIVRNWLVVDGHIIENAQEVFVENVKNENTLLGIILEMFESSYVGMLVGPDVLSYNFDNLAQPISLLLANSLLIFFTGILLLIVFKIIINIVVKLLEKKFDIKEDSLSVFNRFLGGVVGAVKGVLTCASLFVMISFLITFPFLESARVMLLEEESIVAGKMATMSFSISDKLLFEDDITKMLANSGFEQTINLEDYEPDDEYPDDEYPDDEEELEPGDEIDNEDNDDDIQTYSLKDNLLALAS